MIFYFSGTGNSLYAAKTIARAQNEQLASIADEYDRTKATFEYEVRENELLGFVYPVYAWAPPKIVMDFISHLKISGGKPFVFNVSVCGDEEGKTTAVLQKKLVKSGLQLESSFSLVMPNNYIVGFDTDPKELELKKLQNAEQRLEHINEVLSQRKQGITELKSGKLGWTKTYLVNPLFNQFARNPRYFYATEKCNGCGLCERICPVHTITVEQKPTWGKHCTQCLGCINRCPVQAIQYAKATVTKGRYVHPDL
ncbi:MAG: EFR1 family ferrodoxin [Thermoclostridium sp.]|nr:EFR1 family ferrodoxin [Thermoclostridium sp.]